MDRDLQSHNFFKSTLNTCSIEGFAAEYVPMSLFVCCEASVKSMASQFVFIAHPRFYLQVTFQSCLYYMSLLLATRLEYHLNSLTLNANQMRRLFIGPSCGRPQFFSWAVSINGATEHYTEGFVSPPAPIGSHSHSVVALSLFTLVSCLFSFPPTPLLLSLLSLPIPAPGLSHSPTLLHMLHL